MGYHRTQRRRHPQTGRTGADEPADGARNFRHYTTHQPQHRRHRPETVPLQGLPGGLYLRYRQLFLQGNEYHPRVPYGGVAATFFPDGYVAIANSNVTQYNSDIMGTYETNLGAKFTSTTTAGYQFQFLRSDFTGQEGRDLAPLIQNISAASNIFTLPVQSISKLSVNGYFLQETFGYDEMLYLTLAGRVDGSSAFSTDNQSNFYPKASLSWWPRACSSRRRR
ncbi:MAG: TonB-dependent receptor [Lewinellaceae bacterium]|nr:TonB-dependent receptor [Lewinellaceae bacterium]